MVWFIITGWWFGTMDFLWLSIKSWECHHPNWRTHSIIFQRGRAQPPTSMSRAIFRDKAGSDRCEYLKLCERCNRDLSVSSHVGHSVSCLSGKIRSLILSYFHIIRHGRNGSKPLKNPGEFTSSDTPPLSSQATNPPRFGMPAAAPLRGMFRCFRLENPEVQRCDEWWAMAAPLGMPARSIMLWIAFLMGGFKYEKKIRRVKDHVILEILQWEGRRNKFGQVCLMTGFCSAPPTRNA